MRTLYLWSPYGIGQTIIFHPVVCSIFFLSSYFPCLISTVADWMSMIPPHTVWCWWEFRMQVWNMLHAARWNTGRKNDAKIRHLRTIAQLCRAISSQLRHILTIRKKLVKQQYTLHMFSQYGELRPISGWDRFTSSGHPSKFQWVSGLGFVIAPRSLNGGPSAAAMRPYVKLVWPLVII